MPWSSARAVWRCIISGRVASRGVIRPDPSGGKSLAVTSGNRSSDGIGANAGPARFGGRKPVDDILHPDLFGQ